MQSEWNNYSLAEIINIIGGGTPRRAIEEYWNGDIPWLSVVDFNTGNRHVSTTKETITQLGLQKSSTKLLEAGQLIISARGTVGALAQLDKPMAFNQSCYGLDAKEEYVTNDYLYYLVKKKVRDLQQITHGAVFDTITKDTFKQIDVELPSLPTQKKIAHILSTLDDKIELNRKMNQTLEEMAQALFKSWFVDFDPVHAKAAATGDVELEEAATELGLSKEILELFPSEFEESEMGMIPKGWKIVKIEEILKRYRAPKRYKKDAVESYGRTVVLEQGSDIVLGYHDNGGEFEATEEEPMFIFGDHTCIMKLSTNPFSISENVIPLSASIRNGYWTYYATYGQQSFQEYRRHWSELIVRKVVLADEKICDFFAEKIKSLVLKVEQNISENNELVMTRDILLPKLLSGELDVSNINTEQKEEN